MSTLDGKKYVRYKATRKIARSERKPALAAYIEHYAGIARTTPAALNQKLPKSTFEIVLGEVGGLLQTHAKAMAEKDGPVKTFLERNPVPTCLGTELTPEIRAFCLILNALRQWSVGEQLAMDRLLLSGNVRKDLKELFTTCPVAPTDVDKAKVELHHPLRDGRPPVPLSKTGHDTVEGLLVPQDGDSDATLLVAFRRACGPISWKRLRVGVLDLLGNAPEEFAEGYRTNARAWARKATRETGVDAAAILAFLDRYDLGALDE
jgi:hypothetical protein